MKSLLAKPEENKTKTAVPAPAPAKVPQVEQATGVPAGLPRFLSGGRQDLAQRLQRQAASPSQDALRVDAGLPQSVKTPPVASTASSPASSASASVAGVPRTIPFVEMKRNGIEYGLRPPFIYDYGHWWTEIDGSESYGWWPDHCPVTTKETFLGTGGELNGGKGCGPPTTQQ